MYHPPFGLVLQFDLSAGLPVAAQAGAPLAGLRLGSAARVGRVPWHSPFLGLALSTRPWGRALGGVVVVPLVLLLVLVLVLVVPLFHIAHTALRSSFPFA